MKLLYLIDNKKKAIVQICQIYVNEPHQVIFCKDRKTKKKYIMVREENANPFDLLKRQLFETEYCQYDDISIDIK